MNDTSLTRQRFSLITVDAGRQETTFARDVAAGLTAHPKWLHCRYFYDQTGSDLFDEICTLPEYYLPRAETEILQSQAAEIVAQAPRQAALVELGSGTAAKTRILIEAMLRRQGGLCYLPIDICRPMLEESSRQLLRDYPALEVSAIAGEYRAGLRHLRRAGVQAKLILWLGSNVGNFHRHDAAEFLHQVRETMDAGDRLLVGIDLRKERALLERAYDDTRGVTARFNLNLLARINRELGGCFDLDAFRHRAVYNEELGRIEMYLVSTRVQCVAIKRLELELSFAAGEAIHTENSYKYSADEINALALAGGFKIGRQWFDAEHRFSETLLAPAG